MGWHHIVWAFQWSGICVIRKKINLLLSVMCQYIHCGLIIWKIKENFVKNLSEPLLNVIFQNVWERSFCHVFSEIKPSNDMPDGYLMMSWSCPKRNVWEFMISYLPKRISPNMCRSVRDRCVTKCVLVQCMWLVQLQDRSMMIPPPLEIQVVLDIWWQELRGHR